MHPAVSISTAFGAQRRLDEGGEIETAGPWLRAANTGLQPGVNESRDGVTLSDLRDDCCGSDPLQAIVPAFHAAAFIALSFY